MSEGLIVRPGCWYAWQQFPCDLDALFAGTPAFVASVEPQKTGNGDLKVEFVAALNVEAPKQRKLNLRVHAHEPDHLMGVFTSQSGRRSTGVLSAVGFEWLERFCAPYVARFPASRLLPNEESPTVGEYLNRAFGESEHAIVGGATPRSFGVELHPLPKERARLPLEVDYSLFDSYLLRRGTIPRDMEDKWFAYFEGETLLMRRSWTGHLVYEVHCEQVGEGLYAAFAYANRDPDQYKCDSDEEDRQLLLRLIDELLLGKRPSAAAAS